MSMKSNKWREFHEESLGKLKQSPNLCSEDKILEKRAYLESQGQSNVQENIG
jgi:hypothetical protein